MSLLREALRGNQAATNQFWMAGEGMIQREAFFDPENMESLLGRATTGSA